MAKVFYVPFENQAEVKIFETDMMHQADILVWKSHDWAEARGDERWVEVDVEFQADRKLFRVRFENQADLRVYYVDQPHEARWVNTSSPWRGKFGS